jgi:hypothetical protein
VSCTRREPPPRRGCITRCTHDACREPLGLIPKEPLPERWRAKQFGTVAPKSGKTMDVYFDTKHAYLAENDK